VFEYQNKNTDSLNVHKAGMKYNHFSFTIYFFQEYSL